MDPYKNTDKDRQNTEKMCCIQDFVKSQIYPSPLPSLLSFPFPFLRFPSGLWAVDGVLLPAIFFEILYANRCISATSLWFFHFRVHFCQK